MSRSSATALHRPMRRGRRAARRRSGAGSVLARRIGLARWNMGPRRRRIRPNRLRHPRRFGRAAEAQKRREEIGAKPLKHPQEWLVGEDNQCVHAASHRVRGLTERSDGTATTPKIVSYAICQQLCSNIKEAQRMRPRLGGLIARASRPAALRQAAGGWRPAPRHSWRKGRRPCRESPRRHPDPWWPLQISERSPLVQRDISFPAQSGSPRTTQRRTRSDYALRRNPFRRGEYKSELLRQGRAGRSPGSRPGGDRPGITPRPGACRFPCG